MYNFWGHCPHLGVQKTSKKCDFGQLLTLTVNISGTSIDIENWKQTFSTAIAGGFSEKKFVNFGPLVKKL